MRSHLELISEPCFAQEAFLRPRRLRGFEDLVSGFGAATGLEAFFLGCAFGAGWSFCLVTTDAEPLAATSSTVIPDLLAICIHRCICAKGIRTLWMVWEAGPSSLRTVRQISRPAEGPMLIKQMPGNSAAEHLKRKAGQTFLIDQ